MKPSYVRKVKPIAIIRVKTKFLKLDKILILRPLKSANFSDFVLILKYAPASASALDQF